MLARILRRKSGAVSSVASRFFHTMSLRDMFPGNRDDTGRSQYIDSFRLRLIWLSWVRLAMLVVLAVSTLLFSRDSVGTLLDSIRGFLLWFTVVCIVLASLYFPVLLVVRSQTVLRAVAVLQIIQDSAFAAVMVVATGGSSSGFTFFFPLMIIIAGLVLPRAGSLIGVLISALFLMIIAVWEAGLAVPPDAIAPIIVHNSAEDLVYTYVINLIAFAVVAVLSSFLVTQVQKSDIQRERYRVNLEDLRILHETILSSLDTGLVTLSLENEILHLNRAAEELLGVSLKAVKGMPLPQILPELAHPIEEVEGDVDVRRLTAGAEEQCLLIAVKPLLSSAWEMVGRLIRIQDVTEMRHMEMQRKSDERLATIGKMSAVIAHEIRNPLAAISASAQMVSMSREVSEDDRLALDIVVKETDHLNEWISDLLEYARPRKDVSTAFEVASPLLQAVHIAQALPGAAGIVFSTDLSPGLIMRGDALRFSRVAVNIVKNAVEAVAGDGTIEIRSYSEAAADGEHVIVTFRNDGPIIPPADLARIFDVFFTTKARGTGLGLASAVKYCEDFGGTVSAVSNEQEGTVFKLDIPLRSDA